MSRRVLILRIPKAVDLDILKKADKELTKVQRQLKRAFRKMRASWQPMPGMKVVNNKRLWLLRVDGNIARFQQFLADHSLAWTIPRMRRVHRKLVVDGNGDPVLDVDGNKQHKVFHDRKNKTQDNVIKSHMILHKDKDGNDMPFSGKIRLPYHDNSEERNHPEYVIFV